MHTRWNIDLQHSEVYFKVKYLSISSITGYFSQFDVEMITIGDDFHNFCYVKFSAVVNSLQTNNKERDLHLKSPDFLNERKYPKICFFAKGPVEADGVKGLLRIKHISKYIVLWVKFGGLVIDPNGQARVGISIGGSIKLKDFDVRWNKSTDAGVALIDGEISVQCEIQLVKYQHSFQ